MISYSLSWITTYLQICSSGKQTLLTYTKESHWAKPFSSQTWTAPCQATIWDRCTGVALKPDPAFKGLPESPPPHPPEWFLTSPIQAQAESCLPPIATTLNVLERHTRVPCSPLSSLPELVLRLLAWLSSNYGCIETRGDSCQEGRQQMPPVHSLILVVMEHLFKFQIKKSGCQGPGEGLSHGAATSNTNALGKLQPEPGHNHGSCAEKVGTVHGLSLSRANFQSEVVSLLV